MAVRICPHCKAEISASNVVAYSFGFDCPKCGTRLEAGSGAGKIASLCGLLAGAIAWRLSSDSEGDLAMVLPTLYAFLAFGIVSPLVLMFTCNLRHSPAVLVPELARDHGAGSHGGHDIMPHSGGHH